MTAVQASLDARTEASVTKFVTFLESGGAAPDGLFAEDVFGDLTFPHWRVQTEGAEELVASRRRLHPQQGKVRLEKVTSTGSGYALKLEERWQDGGQEWYCREGFIVDLDDAGAISDFTLYCTGDWDQALQAEHARTVTLPRP